jgi:hypothetical protein
MNRSLTKKFAARKIFLILLMCGMIVPLAVSPYITHGAATQVQLDQVAADNKAIAGFNAIIAAKDSTQEQKNSASTFLNQATQKLATDQQAVDAAGGPAAPAASGISGFIAGLSPICTWYNPGTWVSCIIDSLATLVSLFLSAFIAFAGLLLNVVLALSSTLVASPIVKTGFSITLALMNLGLVIAALFMAVATIAEPVLGNDTYAIKKRLPTLILVAVLANFLLLGAGAVIKFSDGASYYFASQASPGTGGAASFGAFATKLAGAFKPQGLLDVKDLSSGANVLTNSITAEWRSVANLLFVVIFELFIFVVILLAALMFLIRYLYLGVLLIIAPLALLTSLFPSLSSHWKNWCTKFLHWTMFGPLMMLGLYLAILGSQKRGDFLSPVAQQVTTDPKSAVPALQEQVGRNPGFWQNLMEMVMVLGIAGGGIMMANSFAPKFAQSAMSGAQNLGKRGKEYLGRRGAQIVTRPLASQQAQNRFAQMQGSSNIATRWAGRALEGIGIRGQKAGEEQAKNTVAGKSARQINNNWTTMNDGEKIAALEKLRQEANLGLIDRKKLETDLPRLKGIMDRQGRGELFEQVNKESGTELREAMKNLGAARSSGEIAAINAANARIMEATKGVDVDKIAATFFPSAEKLKSMNLGESDLKLLKATQRQFMQNMMESADAGNMGDIFNRISKNGQMDQLKKLLGDETDADGNVVVEGIRKRAENGDIKASDEFKRWSVESPAMRTFGFKADDFGTGKNFKATPVSDSDFDIATDDFGEHRVPRAGSSASPTTPAPGPGPAQTQGRKFGATSRNGGGNGTSGTAGKPALEPELVGASSGR